MTRPPGLPLPRVGDEMATPLNVENTILHFRTTGMWRAAKQTCSVEVQTALVKAVLADLVTNVDEDTTAAQRFDRAQLYIREGLAMAQRLGMLP